MSKYLKKITPADIAKRALSKLSPASALYGLEIFISDAKARGDKSEAAFLSKVRAIISKSNKPPRGRRTRRNHAMLTKGQLRSGAVSQKTLATRRYSSVRAPYSKLHKAMMTSMSRGGSQYEALAALRGKRSGMSLAKNPKRRKKNRKGKR